MIQMHQAIGLNINQLIGLIMTNRLVFILVYLIGLLSCTAHAGPSINMEHVAVIDKPLFSNNLKPIEDWLFAQSAAGVDSVDLIINSPGGVVQDGLTFISRLDAVRAKGMTVRCFVPDLAASMAFQVYMHCDERYALRKAFLLWHHVSASLQGSINAPTLRLILEQLDVLDRQLIQDLVETIPMERTELLRHLDGETFHLSGELATQAAGFITGVSVAIPGLFEALNNPKVPHQSAPNLLELLFGGNVLAGGIQFLYIQPGYLETVNAVAKQHPTTCTP